MEGDDGNIEEYVEKVVALKGQVREQGEIISANMFIEMLTRLRKEYQTIISILYTMETLTPETMMNGILKEYQKKKVESDNTAKALATFHQPPQAQPLNISSLRVRVVEEEIIVEVMVVTVVVDVGEVDEVDKMDKLDVVIVK
jgi:hypothetical protein